MKEVFLLTKILLKSSITSHKQKDQKNSSPLKIFGCLLVYLYIAGVVGFFSFEAISALKLIGQEAVFLNLCLVVMLGMTTMRTLFTSMNMLFFSKDIEFLLPLPVKTYKIVMAKLNCLIISEYMMYLLIFIPVLLVYGVLLHLNIWFYVIGVFIMLLFPIIPVMFVSLIMTVIMKFTNLIKNKDFVQYITVILSLVLVLGVSFLTGADQQITNEQFANMLVETNGLVEIYTKTFFTLKPAMQALINYDKISGILNLCFITIETIIAYIGVIAIMSKLYIKTVTNTVASGTSSKFKQDDAKMFKKTTEMKSYVKKEFRDLVRNPIFFMQCIAPAFLLPIVIFISMYMGLKNGNLAELEQLKTELSSILVTPTGIASCIAIAIFFYMFNYISITSISRDGENAVFMKYIPISLEKQCLYKILPGIILNIVPMIYITIGLKLILQDNISFVYLFAMNLIALLYNVFNNYIMIIIDLNKPKLHWTTEYAVVKQNMNMLWECLIYLLEIVILIFWGVFVQSLSLFVTSVGMILFLAIQKTRKYINKNQNKLFEKII